MPRFHYIARSRTGERLEVGTVEATDKRTALLQIERQGHKPVAVHETAGAAAALGAGRPAGGPRPGRKRFRLEPCAARTPRVKMRDVVMFTRELSDLLASGMTLGNALHTLSAQDRQGAGPGHRGDARRHRPGDQPFRDTGQVARDVLAAVRQPRPRRRGQRPEAQVLERLCTYYEMVQGARCWVFAALIYPGIVLGMGVGTMIFTMVFVVPRFTAIFKELGSTLPLATQLLMGLSTVMLRYGWAIAPASPGWSFSSAATCGRRRPPAVGSLPDAGAGLPQHHHRQRLLPVRATRWNRC